MANTENEVEIFDDEGLIGEHFDVDMRQPVADDLNSKLTLLQQFGRILHLGEHGEIHSQDIESFGSGPEQGQLVAFIRKEAKDPKVVVPVVLALGIAATAVYKSKKR